MLYGVFWATSQGGWNLDPDAWGGQFPAQIRVRGIQPQMRRGEVLTERQFRPVIAGNYFDRTRFDYHLTRDQIQHLQHLLESQGWQQTPLNPSRTTPLRTPIVHRMNRAVQIKKKGKKAPVLKLMPGRSPPLFNRSRKRHRYFAGLRGFNVLVDERFPVTHHAPPRETRVAKITRQASEDRMEVEMTPPGPPMEAPLTKQSFQEINQQPMVHQSLLAASGMTQRQHWSLGELSWDNSDSFRSFITGINPQSEAQNSVQVHTANNEDNRTQETIVIIEDSSPERENQSIEKSVVPPTLEVGEIVEIESSSDEESISISPLEEIQATQPLERKVSMLKNNLASNFGVLGCEVSTNEELPPEQQVPGANLDHLGVILTSKSTNNTTQKTDSKG